mgnify:CR=1 FL=1
MGSEMCIRDRSKENKEEYKKYLTTTKEPLTYIQWLKEIKSNDI